MPQSGNPSTTSPAIPEEFGANEWLVEEMHDRYQKDPNSVDPTWAAYFSGNGSGNGSGDGSGDGSSDGSGVSTDNGTPAKAAPRAAAAKTAAEPAAKPAAKPAPKPAEKPTEAEHKDPTPTPAPAPVAKPRHEAKAAEPAKGTSDPVPKDAPPAERPAASDEPQLTVLRGAPARTAANMDASLTVPTATSVRSVPVKLLWDNRTVINNHLARARGGKVSFTHLIGFALVKALRSMPEMNVGFDTVDGKPNLIQPAHINLCLLYTSPSPRDGLLSRMPSSA